MRRGSKTITCEVCDAPGSCFLEKTLPPEMLTEYRRSQRRSQVKAGDVLFREGEEASGVWVICTGRIKISRQASGGKPLTIRISYPGELVGYRSFFAGQLYMGSAVAMEASTVAFLDRTWMGRFLQSGGEFGGLLMTKLARDLGHAESVAANMAYQCSRDRVFDVLSQLYHSRAWRDPGQQPEALRIRRKDLAELAGLTVETTVRVLKDFERTGLLEISGRRMRIVDLDQFNAMLEDYCPV